MAELVREVVIDATPDTIFPFLTESAEYIKWEGTEAELDARPGGVYRVVVAGTYRASGAFVEVVPNERVVFTMGWEDEGNPVPPGSSTVEITLHPEGNKTRVRLVHKGLPEGEPVEQHIHGWDHYMGRLATVAAGGDAGPDNGPTG